MWRLTEVTAISLLLRSHFFTGITLFCDMFVWLSLLSPQKIQFNWSFLFLGMGLTHFKVIKQSKFNSFLLFHFFHRAHKSFELTLRLSPIFQENGVFSVCSYLKHWCSHTGKFHTECFSVLYAYAYSCDCCIGLLHFLSHQKCRFWTKFWPFLGQKS